MPYTVRKPWFSSFQWGLASGGKRESILSNSWLKMVDLDFRKLIFSHFMLSVGFFCAYLQNSDHRKIPRFFLIHLEPKISKIHADLTKLWLREHFHSSQLLEATPWQDVWQQEIKDLSHNLIADHPRKDFFASNSSSVTIKTNSKQSLGLKLIRTE